MKRIYADAAAATPLSRAAYRELVRLLGLYGNPGGLHQEALAAKEELEKARQTIAQAIGAHKDEIIFTSGGTESNNLAIAGILRPLLAIHGELHAITTAIEHQSILEPLRALEREGLYITELPVNSEGLVDPKVLAEAITEETAFISVQLVNSEIGTIEPVREIAKEIKQARLRRISPARPVYFHTDASQAPLWLPLSVEKLGIDLMTLDGQKVLGPKGVGALYARRGSAMEPVLSGGGQEAGLRGGTEDAPLAGSLAVALLEASRGVEARAVKSAAMRNFLWDEIKKLIPSAEINGAVLGENRVANNLNISIPDLAGDMAVLALDAEGVAASTRSACGVGEAEPSHVLLALGAAHSRALGAIRFSLLPDAKKSEMKRIAKILASIAARYTKSASRVVE